MHTAHISCLFTTVLYGCAVRSIESLPLAMDARKVVELRLKHFEQFLIGPVRAGQSEQSWLCGRGA